MFTGLLDVDDQSKAISNLTFTGSARNDSQPTLYHWCFYAAIPTSSSGVLFDITPGADGQTAVLIICSKSSPVTTAADHSSFRVTLNVEYTIRQLMDWIATNQLDRYMFTSEGTGCRFWCAEVLKRLEGDRILPAGSTDKFVSFLASESKLKPISVPEVAGEGIFY